MVQREEQIRIENKMREGHSHSGRCGEIGQDSERGQGKEGSSLPGEFRGRDRSCYGKSKWLRGTHQLEST